MCETPASHRSGWRRFQEYVSLVREIVIDPFTDTANKSAWGRPQDTFWGQLCSTLHPKPILPRLERAAIRSTKTRDMRVLGFLAFRVRGTKNPLAIDTGMLRLLNPALHELDIQVTVSQHATPSTLDKLGKALATCFSSMQSLEVLSIDVPNLASILDVESLPRSHPRLRYLKLNDRASSGLSLRALTALPNLEYLHTNLCRSTARVTLPSGRITLAGLRSLSVSCSEVAAISNLLAHVNAPSLEMFSVCRVVKDYSAEPLLQELSKILRTLVARCPSLTAFEWSSTVQSGARRAGHLAQGRSTIPLAKFFAPLLSHRAMRGFSVRFDGRGPVVPYTLADFRAIAEAWPDLETFRLRDDGGCDRGADGSASSQSQEERVGLECAFAFARHCPRLRVLHLPKVELAVGGFGSDVARCPPEPHAGLRELHVGRVVCVGEQQPGGVEDEVRRQKAVAQLRFLMKKAFPSAAIQIGG